jgi:hypothetical protein
VPKVCTGKVGYARKINHQRRPQQIRHPDRKIDRMVVDSTLSPLHPVDDALTPRIGGTTSTHCYPGVL